MLQLCVMLTNPLAIHAVNIRQALLCEAKNRVENLLGRVHLLESPNMQNGISLQITRQQAPCGGNDVPITIGHFTIEGAEVEDAFNALTDTRKVWDPLVDSSIKLGQFPDQQAIGLALSFTAHPFQDREFYEWMVVNTTDPSDLWVVYSTLSNDALHLIKPRARSKVEAQNCLGAYRFQRGMDGRVHTTFTSQINPHPFLVSAAFAYHMAWHKTVESMTALRAQAQKLAKERNGASPILAAPAWMMTEVPSSNVTKIPPSAPYSTCWTDRHRLAVYQYFDALHITEGAGVGAGVYTLLCVFVAVLAAGFVLFQVKYSRKSSEEPSLLQLESGDPEESAIE